MIRENLLKIKQEIPAHVTLVAVSKTKPVELLQEAYDAGQRIFGENRVQELIEKHAVLPTDIKWHMIGHLQTKKVKQIASFVALIHGVDSIKLLTEINKHALANNRIIDCLLQFHIAQEDTKFGFNLTEVSELLETEAFFNLKNVRIIGVMGMATFTDNTTQIEQEFAALKEIFNNLKQGPLRMAPYFEIVSMGMSGDYKIAIQEGSTMIRVGSSIFGNR